MQNTQQIQWMHIVIKHSWVWDSWNSPHWRKDILAEIWKDRGVSYWKWDECSKLRGMNKARIYDRKICVFQKPNISPIARVWTAWDKMEKQNGHAPKCIILHVSLRRQCHSLDTIIKECLTLQGTSWRLLLYQHWSVSGLSPGHSYLTILTPLVNSFCLRALNTIYTLVRAQSLSHVWLLWPHEL